MRLVRVDPASAGSRLDVFVAALEDVGSRAEAQRLIAEDRVTLNGRPARKRDALASGDEVEVRPRAAPSTELVPEAGVPFSVAYEDEHLLVIDKPAGVVVHPARGHDTGTLVHGLIALDAAGGDDPTRPGIVHRLDRDTSGLLVVARSPRAHRRLQRMLRDRAIDRRYLALVHGEPPPAMSIDRPLARHPRDRTRMAVVPGGREAVTHVKVRERFPGLALCEVRLETGRTHQIRVHLETVNHPVVGDPVYGRGRGTLGLPRQFLHAWRLTFPHPEREGETVDAESPLPDDLAEVLDRLRR
ncbi:MAG: RluA family pseudouridine synthase [Thermoleophilia bacterium]|nr:RluA family pseudouridine synthase [Thermoleophilia bacterium]